jgi:hypothetical protein
MKIRIDHTPNAPPSKRELRHTLNLFTDPHTPTTKNTLIAIPPKQRRTLINRIDHRLPGILNLPKTILIDQPLKLTLPLLLTARANHRMIEKDELKLKPARLYHPGRVSKDLHPTSCRSKTGGDQLRPSLLLHHTEPTGPKRSYPWIVAERRNLNPYRASRLKNSPTPLNLNLHPVNR